MSQKMKRFALALTMAFAMVVGLATPAFATWNNSKCWPVWPFDPCTPEEPADEPVDEGTVFEKDDQLEVGKNYTLITEIDGEHYALAVVIDEDGNKHLVIIPIDVFDEDGNPYVVVTDPSMIWTVISNGSSCSPDAIDFYNEATDTKLSDLLKDLGIKPSKIYFEDGKIVIVDCWGKTHYITIDEDGNPALTPNKDDAASFDPYVECPDHPVPTLYEVVFVDEDGNVISDHKYPEGTPADKIKVPADPTKDPDDEYSYEFAGWTPDGGEHVYPADQLPPVTGDVEYCPWFNPIPREYTVTFLDAEGNPISSEKYAKDTPADQIKVPADPYKAPTDESWFEFIGWDPEIGPVTGDVTYKPVYEEWTLAKWKRLGGKDRYGTMAKIATEAWDSSDTVVLATGKNFPDALVASSIAGLYDCPIILTETGEFSQAAKDELTRLGVKTVYVMGGNAAVSDSVLSEIEAMGITCNRVYGKTRQLTSLNALNMIVEAGKYNGTIVVATGGKFPDSLSVGPWCNTTCTPIILTNDDLVLTDEEMARLAELGVQSAIIVGGEAAVSPEVEEQLASLGATDITRLSGKDRFETSAAIAEWEIENQNMTRVNVSVATGAKFPDALSGAALCGDNNSVILLVSDDMLGAEPAEEGANLQPLDLINNKAGIRLGYVFGGSGVVSEEMFAHLESLTAAPIPVTAE